MRRSAWIVDEADFYELDGKREQLEFMLRYAILAPSSRNTQPWSFRIGGDGVEVFVDYTRRLPIADPFDRELLMSVGAAITNFRVAAAHFGFETTVLYQDRPEETLPVAVIAVRETCATDPDLRHLFPAIQARRTNRGEFEARPIDDDARSALCQFVDDNMEFVRFVVAHDRARTADLVTAGDRILFSNEAFREEFAQYLPGVTSGFDVLRRFHLRDRVNDAAALLVLTSDEDRTSLIRAGETLERLLLLLTRSGLQYSFLNEPLEVEGLRDELWSMIRSPRPPQLLLRIGYGKPVARPQPRRKLNEVITSS